MFRGCVFNFKSSFQFQPPTFNQSNCSILSIHKSLLVLCLPICLTSFLLDTNVFSICLLLFLLNSIFVTPLLTFSSPILSCSSFCYYYFKNSLTRCETEIMDSRKCVFLHICLYPRVLLPKSFVLNVNLVSSMVYQKYTKAK